MSKFTKGKWFIDNTGYYTRISTEDFYVCEIKRGPKANAHLIASAPDMYKLLEAINDDVSQVNVITIRKLLSKARGES